MIYKGIILTNHALERMRERGVSEQMVYLTINKPDRSRYADNKRKFIYNKTFGSEMVEVVASKNERREWVVVSVWSRPEWQMRHNQYYVKRNGVIEWLLDKIEAFFTRKK
jgi:hypothetical protein